MHRVSFHGKIVRTLEIEEKDLGGEGRTFGVRISRKIQLQSRRNHHEQNNVLQIYVHVSIVQTKKYGCHGLKKKLSRSDNV